MRADDVHLMIKEQSMSDSRLDVYLQAWDDHETAWTLFLDPESFREWRQQRLHDHQQLIEDEIEKRKEKHERTKPYLSRNHD